MYVEYCIYGIGDDNEGLLVTHKEKNEKEDLKKDVLELINERQPYWFGEMRYIDDNYLKSEIQKSLGEVNWPQQLFINVYRETHNLCKCRKRKSYEQKSFQIDFLRPLGNKKHVFMSTPMGDLYFGKYDDYFWNKLMKRIYKDTGFNSGHGH